MRKKANNKNDTLEKLIYLNNYLKSENILLKEVLRVSKETVSRLLSGEEQITDRHLKRLVSYFHNVTLLDMKDENVVLPPYEELKFQQKTAKLRYLNSFLLNKYQITIARVLSVSDRKMRNYLSGMKLPSKRLIKLITNYFFLNRNDLLDDEKKLPPYDQIRIDENLISIQRRDIENNLNFFRNRHIISKNYRVLSHGRRLQLIISLTFLMVPLLGYTGYCYSIIAADRFDTKREYREGDEVANKAVLEMQEEAIHHNEDLNSTQVYVNIGSQIIGLHSIDAKSSSYCANMTLWFDFDLEEFHKMYYMKEVRNKQDDEYEKFVKIYNNNYLRSNDEWIYHTVGNYFERGKDNVPDYIQIADYATHYNETDPAKLTVAPFYIDETSYYPGYTSSNNYPDYETMFKIGNGDFNADAFSYERTFTPYRILQLDGTYKYRGFQSMSFDASIRKAFDNPRYPLESVQFHIYILPRMFSDEYVRYVPGNTVYLRESDGVGIKDVFKSGVAPSYVFKITGGYKLFDDDSFNSFTESLVEYRDNDEQLYSFTEYEIIIRANRQGISLFLQAFINLFSVVIWIMIAFYNQSHNGEDSIGMLGTGLFGAISSILVGLSMLSDAGFFSLITMINIFTLGVILIMTYQSIAAKRARVKQNVALICYQDVLLRVLFYGLSICTLVMFIVLPITAFII